jgi:hypothetical protein
MRQLSAIALIIFLLVLPSCKFFRGKGLINKKVDKMIALRAKQDSIRIADSIKTIQNRLNEIENARIDSVRKVTEEMEMKMKNRYNIIVGSFLVPENAKGLAEVYKQKGYDTKIIKMDGSKFELVSAEAHESMAKAFRRIKEFQNNIEKDSWVYMVK